MERDVVILGAGISGLSAAYNLSKKDRVLVLEKENSVGGLSKTLRLKEFYFDIGGHRFFTKNKEIESFFLGIMDNKVLEINRKSFIYLDGKMVPYPLKFVETLNHLGVKTSFKIAMENILNRFHSRDVKNFEDCIIENFGKTIYKIYFEPYTEKVWGVQPKYISKDWASERIDNLSLMKTIFHLINTKNRPKTFADRFLYPKKGIGSFSERLSQAFNAKIKLNKKISQINHKNGKITSIIVDNKKVNLDYLVSTIPLPVFINLLNPRPPKEVITKANSLKYKDLMLCLLTVDKPKITDSHWIYFPEKKFIFSRIHEPKNWDSDMAPEDKTSIVMEIHSPKDKNLWNLNDKDIMERVILDISKTGLLEKKDIVDKKTIRISNAYPFYDMTYKENLSFTLNYLTCFRNLKVIGRTGSFGYYNIDKVIEEGLNVKI